MDIREKIAKFPYEGYRPKYLRVMLSMTKWRILTLLGLRKLPKRKVEGKD